MAIASAMARLDDLEAKVLAQAGKGEQSVYGIVSEIKNGKPKCVRKWEGSIGNMKPSRKRPTVFIAEALEPFILKHKKWKGLYGGRAGTKSIALMDIAAAEVNCNGSGVFCLRERMKSLSQSIYKGINGRIKELGFAGFKPVESKWKIDHRNGGILSFGGLANVEDMKSLFEYKFFLMEEAANTSQHALDTLGPTLRGVDGAELWMAWNPKSANDAMSREFILPFQKYLDAHGYYEDDYHLIINVNYRSNPWFHMDKSLKEELEKDQQKVEQGRMSKARYNHIWEGAFNDEVENSIIEADWFDACIDAHLKLGFKAGGATVASHDPSDQGSDAKAYSCRTGVVVTEACEIDAENANRAFDVATGMAIKDSVDSFLWDCDGLGATLRDQAGAAFKGKKVNVSMFKGSEGVHDANAVFKYADNYGFSEQKTNQDLFWNKRAQNYIALAERMRKTWEAVELGVYHNPDDLISFSSEIKDLQKLRSELSRLPLKPNSHGKIALYSKDEMRRGIVFISKTGERVELKIPSPNLADCIMMSFDKSATIVPVAVAAHPRPIPVMGRR
jgi:phage terminase large subunit